MSQGQPASRREGGCQCGALRYEVTGEPLGLYVCHCRECQKQSASAFGVSVEVRRANFRLLRGTPRCWSRAADSGRILDCYFCADCGSRIWHGSAQWDDTVTVKGGSLDQPPDLEAACHIWTRRKLPGVIIPETARQFSGEPE